MYDPMSYPAVTWMCVGLLVPYFVGSAESVQWNMKHYWCGVNFTLIRCYAERDAGCAESSAPRRLGLITRKI